MSIKYYSGYSPMSERYHVTDELDCVPADVMNLQTLYAHSPEDALAKTARERPEDQIIFQVGELFYETPDFS